MRANYRRTKTGEVRLNRKSFTEAELTSYLESEWKVKEDELYKIAVKDATAQVLAVVFSTLYKPPYNWRKQRLEQLRANVEATFVSMSVGILGKKFDAVDCIEFMKKEFGIDWDKEIENYADRPKLPTDLT